MRIQLALNIDNLDEAIAYYSKLFDAQPHKVRDGYANFSIQSPPLKLVLFENPGSRERLNHLGVEVFDPQQIPATAQRLSDAGILDEIERDDTCCHATQDKLWSKAPDDLALIDALPARYQEAVRLVDIDGIPQEEAARRVGLSLSGMKSRVQRGRLKLKQRLIGCCSVELDKRGRIIDYVSQSRCC